MLAPFTIEKVLLSTSLSVIRLVMMTLSSPLNYCDGKGFEFEMFVLLY